MTKTVVESPYINEGGQLPETNVLLGACDRVPRVAVYILIRRVEVLAGVHKDPSFAEMRFVAAVEVLVDTIQLVEIVGCFGSLRIWILDMKFSNLVLI
jgi:hypothetical protein